MGKGRGGIGHQGRLVAALLAGIAAGAAWMRPARIGLRSCLREGRCLQDHLKVLGGPEGLPAATIRRLK
jgi:hypothetical protein